MVIEQVNQNAQAPANLCNILTRNIIRADGAKIGQMVRLVKVVDYQPMYAKYEGTTGRVASTFTDNEFGTTATIKRTNGGVIIVAPDTVLEVLS